MLWYNGNIYAYQKGLIWLVIIFLYSYPLYYNDLKAGINEFEYSSYYAALLFLKIKDFKL